VHNDAPTQTRRARLGRHLRRNVVGYVALLIAVSMTPLPSWAAATIGTADIKNGAVTTKKLAKNAVKTGKIGPNAVKSPKIADGTVGAADLAAASVTAGKLGTIVSYQEGVDIANGTGNFLQVTCPAGERFITGGATAAGVGIDDGWTIIRSSPIVNGWDAAVWNATGSEGELIVRINCLQG